jgi:hypothetical protein
MRLRTGLVCLRIGTSVRLLLRRLWTALTQKNKVRLLIFGVCEMNEGEAILAQELLLYLVSSALVIRVTVLFCYRQIKI